MLLVRLMRGSVEEQVACLLHDVSHTAFSHVVDRVLENGSDDYHERFFGQIVAESEIPSMLERHGIELTRILKPKSWPILEQVLGKARAGIRVRVLEGVVP